MKKLTLASAIVTSVLAFNANADLKNLYVEGAIGQTDISVENSEDTDDTSFGLLAGYTVFNQGPVSIAAEVGYNRYLDEETKTPLGDATSTLSSVALGGKVGYEVMPKLEVFGRIAYESMEQEVEFLGVSASETSDEFTYGIGASYEVAKQFTVGTQYKYAQLSSETDLSNLNISLGYQF